MEALAALVIVGLGLSGLWQAARDPQMDRAFWLRSLQVILGYLVFIAAGIMVMILLGVGGDTVHQLGLWGFLFGWFGLGFVWLLRLSPSLKPGPPPMALRWTLLDWGLLTLALLGAATAWFTRPPL